MRLKNIKAYGFKSFADKIEIEIKSNITAIVGPNGSGKSNIVDAVRWVLGSQSVKSLRATSSMTDCIFKGSKTREPLKRAEVTLTFENNDHGLNTDLNEVEVKRVLYHTGENEYFINNNRVRLKDITDLFLDTGVGIDSFNIISQGHIETVINSKPEERRTIFEEAAGVLKYKKRKEETLKKLEKTKDNLEKVGLIINELETTLLPLQEQSQLAKKYLEYKKNLEELEIAFIACDIKSKNQEYQTLKSEIKELENQVLELSTHTNQENAKQEFLRLENLKLEEEISKKTATVLKNTEMLSNKISEKEITLERQKYTIDKEKVEQGIYKLKEEELELEKSESVVQEEIRLLDTTLSEKEKILREKEEEISLQKVKVMNLEKKKNETITSLLATQNQMEIVDNNIKNDAKVPYAVKNILNNPRLEGIHGTIGKLIEVKPNYLEAIDTALGVSSNFLVVENEQSAKKSIEYLKENHLGRATFFPRNIIQSRKIEKTILEKIQTEKGYIDIASNLVQYDLKYQNVIENQLGNIIVVDNMDTMTKLAKKMAYKYRIVTLSGEIQHAGGSMSGGAVNKSNSNLKDKLELESLQTKIRNLEQEKEMLMKEYQKKEQELQDSYENRLAIEKEIVLMKEEKNRKEERYQTIQKEHEEKKKELEGTINLAENTLDKQLLQILEEIKKLEQENALIKKELQALKDQKEDIQRQMAEIEKNYKEKTSQQNQFSQSLKDKEIRLGKLDIQLDNLLVTLSEDYNLTYEKAIATYPLEMDFQIAKDTVQKLKKSISELGIVNLGSIEEYERIHTRYAFLTEQKNDLEKSSMDLTTIIEEMDQIMESKFSQTFQQIQTEFQKVFQKLFKGGMGMLKLTDPDHLLTTGIEIIAEPPGKKLNNIGLLSGGEKTLTAIALLFSILNVRPVPFCILDEVEASLDEANVDTFGAYLLEKKTSSEFILITHKKRTMEYADTLYGITMQESGVSKIVSVKLEDK